jgi:hypothetical protein
MKQNSANTVYYDRLQRSVTIGNRPVEVLRKRFSDLDITIRDESGTVIHRGVLPPASGCREPFECCRSGWNSYRSGDRSWLECLDCNVDAVLQLGTGSAIFEVPIFKGDVGMMNEKHKLLPGLNLEESIKRPLEAETEKLARFGILPFHPRLKGAAGHGVIREDTSLPRCCIYRFWNVTDACLQAAGVTCTLAGYLLVDRELQTVSCLADSFLNEEIRPNCLEGDDCRWISIENNWGSEAVPFFRKVWKRWYSLGVGTNRIDWPARSSMLFYHMSDLDDEDHMCTCDHLVRFAPPSGSRLLYGTLSGDS